MLRKKTPKKSYPRLPLIQSPEAKSTETVAQYAKKLLDRFEPSFDWEILENDEEHNKIACTLQVGNVHGFYSSIAQFVAALENVGKLPGINMTKLPNIEAGGYKFVCRGFTIKDPTALFTAVLGKMKAVCEAELKAAENEFSQANNGSEKKAAEYDLKMAYTEFEEIETLTKQSMKIRLK